MNLGGIMAILLLGVVLLPNLLDYEELRRSQHTKVFGCLQYPSRFFDPRVQSRREGPVSASGLRTFLARSAGDGAARFKLFCCQEG